METDLGRWQATPGWWLRRIIGSAVTVGIVGWFALHATGHAGAVGNPAEFLMSHSVHRVPVFFVVFAAIVVGIALTALVSRGRTARAATEFAQAQGWEYARRSPAFEKRWQTAPFGQGSGRRAEHVVTGSVRGRPCAAFRYSYTTGSGDNRSTTTLSIVTVALDGPLPGLRVVPESLVGIVAPGLTREDIDIEDETFNRFNRVTADRRDYAVAVLNPRAVEALLRVAPFAWRIDGSDLVGWSTVGRLAVDLARIEALAAVAANVPGFVLRDHGITSRLTPGQP